MECTSYGLTTLVVLGVLIPLGTDYAIAVFVSSLIALVAIVPLIANTAASVFTLKDHVWSSLADPLIGNTADLILALVALLLRDITLAQTLVLGAILSNLLLLLGFCLVLGGIRGHNLHESFRLAHLQALSSMLMISAISVILPTFLYYLLPKDQKAVALYASRLTSILLLIIYILNVKFVTDRIEVTAGNEPSESQRVIYMSTTRKVSIVFLLIIELAGACLFSKNLIESLRGFAHIVSMKESFVGLFILPLAGTLIKFIHCIRLAANDEMMKVVNVALGSSITLANFLMPVLVIISWRVGEPLSLVYPPFEVFSFFLTVYLTHLVLHDGESNWLEGVMLIFLYLITAISFCYYPDAVA